MAFLKSNHKILIDTSAWIAISVSDEPHNFSCRRIFKELTQSHRVLYTTEMVIGEAITRLPYHGGFHVAEKFYTATQKAILSGTLEVLWSTPRLFAEAWKIRVKFSDHKLSFVDCLTAAQAHQERIKQIFTLDRDFAILGFTVLK